MSFLSPIKHLLSKAALRSYVTLSLVLFVTLYTNAQSLNDKEVKTESKTENIGFKTKETLSVPQAPIPDSPQHSDGIQIQDPSPSETPIKPSVFIDYSQLTQDVQQQVDANKSAGNDLLYNVLKGFTVQINECNNRQKTNQVLGFLSSTKAFVRSDFVSDGLVKIIVEHTFDSVELKELMVSHQIDFNFVNEFYLVNK